MDKPFHLIGIDGGATKVSVWNVNINDNNNVELSDQSSTLSYSETDGYISDFSPIIIQTQLTEMNSSIHLTDHELQQGDVIVRTCATAIARIAKKLSEKPLLIGMGFPGLKSSDGRGIVALANGPRIPDFAESLENKLSELGINLFQPISRLGSDADYCGIGEEYASIGQFKDVQNAYYLGGGTGAADALKLKGKLVPFDNIKPWLTKSWELMNQLGNSVERYASAGGIQWVYSNHYTSISVEELNNKGLYPNRLLEMATQGDPAAIDTFDDVSTNLAMLFFERITTIYTGWLDLFEFVNPNRDIPSLEHPFRQTLLDRIIIGQRLGDLIDQSKSSHILWKQIVNNLTHMIMTYEGLPSKFVHYYCPDGQLNEKIFSTSQLREAPVLGAAMDAYLNI